MQQIPIRERAAMQQILIREPRKKKIRSAISGPYLF